MDVDRPLEILKCLSWSIFSGNESILLTILSITLCSCFVLFLFYAFLNLTLHPDFFLTLFVLRRSKWSMNECYVFYINVNELLLNSYSYPHLNISPLNKQWLGRSEANSPAHKCQARKKSMQSAHNSRSQSKAIMQAGNIVVGGKVEQGSSRIHIRAEQGVYNTYYTIKSKAST